MLSTSVVSQRSGVLLLIGTLVLALLLAPGIAPSQAQDASPLASVGLALVADGLVAPVDVDAPNDGSGRLFIVDRTGQIYQVGGDGQMVEQPLLDLSDRLVELNPDYDERGLLSLALHPDFANNGRFFVFYTAPPRPEAPVGYTNTNVLAEYTLGADGTVDPASERLLLQLDHPEPNHNGGDMAFGPDGFLYLSLGDGGGGNDEGLGHTEAIGNGQDLSKLHGKILRLNVDGGDPYGIPEDNPFANQAGAAPEIYAYGLRNPWRMSFDSMGNLYVSDAGQELYEEIDVVTAGGNYGWRLMEGAHCFDPASPADPPETCAQTGANGEPLINPVIEFDHSLGVVAVGGALYEGSAIPDLSGQFIFGVWTEGHKEANGRLFAAQPAQPEGAPWSFQELAFGNRDVSAASEQTGETAEGTEGEAQTGQAGEGGEYGSEAEDEQTSGFYLLSVEADANGELYILTTQSQGLTGNTGQVWRLVSDGEAPSAMEEEATPAPVAGVPVEPSLTVDNQPLGEGGTVTIANVVSPGPGWVMIHADDHGYYGAPIGSAPVPAGVSQNVVVPIDQANATMTLHAMLHADAGVQGTLEFPGADVPVTGTDGRVLNVPFVALPTDPSQPITISVALDEFYAMMPPKLPAGMATFSVTNRGTHPHNIEIEGNGIDLKLFETDLAPGETRTAQAELAPGVYEVYCPVDDHADFGMRYIVPVEAVTLGGQPGVATATPAGGQGAAATPAPTNTAAAEQTATPAPSATVAAEATAAPTATAQPEMTATPSTVTPEGASTAPLVISDQQIGGDGTVVASSVTVEAPAWLVIHADASGQPGTVIGWVLVQPGTTPHVAVPIQGEHVTATLHAMLHTDAGQAGTYEFPGPDVPLTDENGQVITVPFTVSVP